MQNAEGDDRGAGSEPVPAGSGYWDFYQEVARRQVAQWLPDAPCRVLDLSGTSPDFGPQLVAAGHEVLRVATAEPTPDPATTDGGPGRLMTVRADHRFLDWLRDESVDAVLAESRALSQCLATEVVVEDVSRVLRPGGRLLLVVDSLGAGLAQLAEQGRWAELADVPSADVVLVPQPGGDTVTRCFWPEELRGLLGDAGLEVDWVRCRTVLAPAAVERALTAGGRSALAGLAGSELQLEGELERHRPGESPGLHLVASARRPGRGRAQADAAS